MAVITSNQSKIENNLGFIQSRKLPIPEIECILISGFYSSVHFQVESFLQNFYNRYPIFSFFHLADRSQLYVYISRANEHSMINSGVWVPPPELPLPNNISVEFEFQCVLQILNCQSFSIMEIITRRTPVEHLNFARGILFSDKRTSQGINITIC